MTALNQDLLSERVAHLERKCRWLTRFAYGATLLADVTGAFATLLISDEYQGDAMEAAVGARSLLEALVRGSDASSQ